MVTRSSLWCDGCYAGNHAMCVGTIECTCYAYTAAHEALDLRPRRQPFSTAPGGSEMSNVGRENFYTCDACGHVTVTVDVDAGSTPMLIDCRAGGCAGMAQSGWYEPKPVGAGPPTWEWVKPDKLDLVEASQEQMLHFSLGGLVLRRKEGEHGSGS